MMSHQDAILARQNRCLVKHFWSFWIEPPTSIRVDLRPETYIAKMPPTGQPVYVSPNPETTKRGAFTEFFLERQCPEDADPKYKHLFFTHQNLMRMLINDSAMDPNREQTFSTPANSKNKVYFM